MVCALDSLVWITGRWRLAAIAVIAALSILVVSVIIGATRAQSGAKAIDTEPPTLELSQPPTATSYRQPITVRGKTTGAVRVSVGERS